MSQSGKTVAIKPSLVAKLFGVPEIVIENLCKGAIEVKRNAEKSIRVNFVPAMGQGVVFVSAGTIG